MWKLVVSLLCLVVPRCECASTKCNEMNDVLLSDLLGGAYNPRYMSLDSPNRSPKSASKRAVSDDLFAVDDKYTRDFEGPAWDFSHLKPKTEDRKITKRATGEPTKPWACESIVKWLDLGEDYFPRYLRTVECTKSDCWYGQYTCKPRSFTVKILKRRRGQCAKYTDKHKTGSVGLPEELRELWIWEERAVNFCCDCSVQ